MLGFPLGILSAAGAGGAAVAGAYELISTTIVSGTATTSVTFSSLGDYSSTYKHLQVRAVVRSAKAAQNSDSMLMRLNGDGGLNYSRHELYAEGTGTVGAYAETSRSSFYISQPPAASATANIFNASVTDLLDAYSTTKNKTKRTMFGSTGVNLIDLASGAWLNTASITTIAFTLSSTDKFLAGSRFSLYGIKG